MAQHDYDIANDTAANVRVDINNALGAIVSNNSGASEPTTTYANQWWYDSSNDILKIRNEADTAWIEVGTVNQADGKFEPSNVLDEDDFASDSDTAVPTQQSTKAYVDGLALGVGQTWQDVSGSRSPGTSYQNTTGRPIQVGINFNTSGNNSVQVSDDNSTWVQVGEGAGNGKVQFDLIIPDGWYYRVIGGSGISINAWVELR